MATEDQLIAGLKAADAAGNTADAQHFADQIKAMRAAPEGTQTGGGPAPRWDILGDIGRAASDSASAAVQDTKAAFPGPKAAENGPIGTLKRLGSALKIPLDALGVVASPLTGAMHGIAGSALSYAMPAINMQDPKQVAKAKEIGLETDPKKAADAIIDKGMMALAPEDPAAVAAGAGPRAAASQARTDALLKNKAITKVADRARADNLTPQQVIDAQKQANANGDKVTLMDLGDKNVRGLAGAVYRAPGQAGKEIGDFLTSRDESATPALTNDIQTNVAKGSTYNAAQDLLNARSAAARPAFDAAMNAKPQVWSPRLQQFLDHPEVQSGLKQGLKLEMQDAITENREFNPKDYGITGFDEAGDPVISGTPTMKALAVAKEGLDAKVAEMRDPTTGRPTKAGLSLKRFRNAYVNELDNLNPEYATARQTWSGPTQSMEAVTDGKQHFTRSESNDQLKAEFDALPAPDKDFYRMGAAEAKVDQLERAPDASDKSKRVVNSERDRKRFRMLFNSDAQAQQFLDAVARKRAAFDTTQAVKGNSATAGRQVEDGALGNAPLALEGARTLAHASGGNLLGVASGALRMKRELGLRNNPALNSEIARLLMEHDLGAGRGQDFLKPLPVPSRDNTIRALVAKELLAAQSGARSQSK